MGLPNELDIIHIAYAFEDMYTEFAVVSMTSILHNTKSKVHFHILENRLSETNKKTVEQIKTTYPHGDWSFYHVEHNENFILYDKTITVETYFRILLPQILSDLDRVLWIDADTVVDADITDLYNFPLENNYVAAVADYYYTNDKHVHAIGLSKQSIYFNAGVLLLNIKEITASGVWDNVFDIIPLLYNRCLYEDEPFLQDQDVLNFVLQDRVIMLPLKYNLMYIYERGDFGGSVPLIECAEAFTRPVIIHYQGYVIKRIAKLGKELILSPFWDKYYYYKKHTCFADPERDGLKIETYLIRLDSIADGILTPYQIYKAKRYEILSSVFDKINDSIKGKKVVVWGHNEHTWLLLTLLAAKGIIVQEVVDGLSKNQFERVFGYVVKSPKMVLENNSDSCFVLINTNTPKVADRIKNIMLTYGFTNQSSYHVYEDLWKIIEGDC